MKLQSENAKHLYINYNHGFSTDAWTGVHATLHTQLLASDLIKWPPCTLVSYRHNSRHILSLRHDIKFKNILVIHLAVRNSRDFV